MGKEMGSDFFKEQGVSDRILNVVFQQIREEAGRDGFHNGRMLGIKQGTVETMNSFMAASTVTNVVYNGAMTIVKFADGEKEIVTYNPKYGYAYDPEKAIMAGILKHVLGNRYIKVLKKYGIGTKNATKAANDVNKIMMQSQDDGYEPNVPEAIDVSPDGAAVNLSDDEKLIQEFASMDPEIPLC